MPCGKYLHAAACHLHKSTNQLSVSTTFLGCRQAQPFLCESRLYSTKDGKPASKDIQGYGRLIQEGKDEVASWDHLTYPAPRILINFAPFRDDL